MNEEQDAAAIRRRLRVVRWVALLDLVLLIALVASSQAGQRDFVRVLGPTHGINFLLLVALAATAALDGLWGWWFPAAIFFSGGPPGALVGEWLIGRRLAATPVGSEAGAATGDAVGPGDLAARRAGDGEGEGR